MSLFQSRSRDFLVGGPKELWESTEPVTFQSRSRDFLVGGILLSLRLVRMVKRFNLAVEIF